MTQSIRGVSGGCRGCFFEVRNISAKLWFTVILVLGMLWQHPKYVNVPNLHSLFDERNRL
jgi:hypothetical protein